MTRDEVQAIIDERTSDHPGPLSRACFDKRDDDCGLWGCQCKCHYVTAAQLRKIVRP